MTELRATFYSVGTFREKILFGVITIDAIKSPTGRTLNRFGLEQGHIRHLEYI